MGESVVAARRVAFGESDLPLSARTGRLASMGIEWLKYPDLRGVVVSPNDLWHHGEPLGITQDR